MSPEVVFTHRCPRGDGGTMISAEPCRKRLELATSPGKMAELPATLRMRLEDCKGCEGPVELEEPITVEVDADPPPRPAKADPGKARSAAVEKKENADMTTDALCKCGKPKGLDKNGKHKPRCDDCLREQVKTMNNPEARAKAAAARRRNKAAGTTTLREQLRAEVRAEMLRDLVAEARAARDELVPVLADPESAREDIVALANGLVTTLDLCGTLGAIQGWAAA